MEFDYNRAVSEVEDLISKVEDPSTGIEDAVELVSRASETLEKCYAFLRRERESQGI